MFYDSSFAVPAPSFNAPVPIINEDPDTGNLVAICINQHWVKYIIGALYQLMLQRTWQTNDPAVLALQQMRVQRLIDLFGGDVGNCCGLRIVDGVIQTTSDGGVTWTNAPQTQDGSSTYDPRRDAPLFPARTGSNIPCLAAANAVACLVELHREVCAWYAQASAVVAFCGLISAILQVLFGVGATTFGLTVKYMTIVNDLLQHTASLTNASFTSQIQSDLTCILYCNADSAGRWNDAEIAEIMLEIAGKSGDMWRVIEIYLRDISGKIGLNNAGTTTSIATKDCSACSCNWCYLFDFSLSQQGWVAYQNAGFNPSTLAVYTTNWGAVNARGVQYPNNWWTYDTIVKTFNAPVTRIEIVLDINKGNSQEGTDPKVYLIDDTGIVQQWNNVTSGTLVWIGTHTFQNLRLQCQAAYRSDGTPTTGTCHVYSIKMRGTGSNPFGSNNC
jgi:hypothetical protein